MLLSTLLVFAALVPGDALSAARLEAHVRHLASDEMAGRETGTSGTKAAAEYLARVLEESGVQPYSEEHGFMQPVPLVRTRHVAAPRLVFREANDAEHVAKFGAGFNLFARSGVAATEALRIVTARSLEEVPVEGDPGVALVMIGSQRERMGWMRERGWSQPPFPLVLNIGRGEGRERSLPRTTLGRKTEGSGGSAFVTVYGDLGAALGDDAFASVELQVFTEEETVVDQNVVGVIPGVGTAAAPELAQQVIVFSAHYDHIGTRAPSAEGGEDEDLVYNGADDDASGTAMVIELARAFAQGEPPARTLVFLLATGEEKGLLGTYEYIDHPVGRALENTVCNLNFEMVGRPDEIVGGAGKLWLSGFERTNLGESFTAAGTTVQPDKRPEQNFFQRSDNIAFVRRGIVGQTFSTYNMHSDYHRVTDEADLLDYDHMEACARAAFAASRLLASGQLSPEWKPGEPDLR